MFQRKTDVWKTLVIIAFCVFIVATFCPFIRRIWGSDYFGGVKTYWSFKTDGEKRLNPTENGLLVLEEDDLYFSEYWSRLYNYRTVSSVFAWIVFTLIFILGVQIFVVFTSAFTILSKKYNFIFLLNVLYPLTLFLMLGCYHLFTLVYADEFSIGGGLWLTLSSCIVLLGATLEYKRVNK